jgi:hypothetical protein
MHKTSPYQIIAHVDLLRSVDRLLKESEELRAKRDALTKLLSVQVPPVRSTTGRGDKTAKSTESAAAGR